MLSNEPKRCHLQPSFLRSGLPPAASAAVSGSNNRDGRASADLGSPAILAHILRKSSCPCNLVLNAHPRKGPKLRCRSPRTYDWRPLKAAKRTRKSDANLTVVSLCNEVCSAVVIFRLVSLQVAKFAICNSCRRPPPPILSTIVMESSDGVYWIADLSLETS